MQQIVVSIVTILTCCLQLGIGTTEDNHLNHHPGLQKGNSSRQARQVLPPSPSACNNSPCLNGGTCEWMDVPITCDCAAGFIGQICEINVDECASNPCINYGYSTRCVDYINGYECECPVGYGGSECATELNECDSEPCQNGGRCTDRFNGFICSCLPGFFGVVCEKNINECLSFPCQNRGRCIDGANSFSCECQLGFHGHRCQYEDNDCASMPCRNGGRCIDFAGGFRCVCAEGYYGRICTETQPTCTRYTCMNGGRCAEGRHGYMCHCQSGFTGFNCETEINECAGYPCRNGGRCKNLVNGYMCSCPTGFTGKRCEQELNVCSNSNCLNGGTCESDREFTYCLCAKGYSGRICQFNENDYSVRLVGGNSENEGRVEIYYRNKWGPVADTEWTLEDASAVCHHLGYHSATEAFAHSEYGNSNDAAQVCEMVCTGNEHVIEDCVLDQPAAGAGCPHKSHVGVVCSELASPCPVSWRSWGSSCYYIDPKPRTWDDAKQTCQKKGASLVHIESELENEFLRDYLEKNHGGYPAAWIGLTDINTEGTWDWLGQQNNSFKNWNLGEPNNGGIVAIIRTSTSYMVSTFDQSTGGQNCVELLTKNGKWNDLECSMKRQTVCETVQETMSSITKMSPGLIAVITVIVIVFIVGGVVAGGLILT